MKFLKLFILGLLILFLANNAQAQTGGNLLSSKDLSTLKVDALTEAEIAQIQGQLKQAGVTIDQVEQQAIAKGMSPAEFAKLKARLSNAKTVANTNSKSPLTKKTASKTSNTKQASDSLSFDNTFLPKINPLLYGSELFSQNNSGFAANQNIATPINYIIGPSDVLKLVVYGVQEYNNDLTVSKEGRVQIENCLLYTSPSPRDYAASRMPSSA